MKITSNIERKPQFKSVTLELTPREALVLGIFCGSFTRGKVDYVLQSGNYLNKTPFSCPDELKGDANPNDSDFIESIFHLVLREISKADKEIS